MNTDLQTPQFTLDHLEKLIAQAEKPAQSAQNAPGKMPGVTKQRTTRGNKARATKDNKRGATGRAAKCAHCKQRPARPNGRYCSDSCKFKAFRARQKAARQQLDQQRPARPVERRKCLYCQKTFGARNSQKLYCCPSHRVKASVLKRDRAVTLASSITGVHEWVIERMTLKQLESALLAHGYIYTVDCQSWVKTSAPERASSALAAPRRSTSSAPETIASSAAL